jgi:4-hydroxy-tetrahydrodipicolinate synthase
MFHGLCAFPVTPLNPNGDSVDERAYAGLVERLAAAGVDSIGALGSTGGYAYLPRDQRKRALRVAVTAAGGVPVIGGIGALRTADVLQYAEDAQAAGVAAALLAPMSYTPLTEDEVYGLYSDVSQSLSVPLCVYDNPSTTHFTFSDELYQRVGSLPRVGAVKIPGVPEDQIDARLATLRGLLPQDVAVGVSGDGFATHGLIAGADAWYSVIAGVFPEVARQITAAATGGDVDTARTLSQRLEPLWDLYRAHGSLRVATAAAQLLRLSNGSLQRPLRPLDDATVAHLGAIIDDLELGR